MDFRFVGKSFSHHGKQLEKGAIVSSSKDLMEIFGDKNFQRAGIAVPIAEHMIITEKEGVKPVTTPMIPSMSTTMKEVKPALVARATVKKIAKKKKKIIKRN
jgi:hypothetical protein